MDVNDPRFDQRPGESAEAYVARCEAMIRTEVDRRLGRLSGAALAEEAHRMRMEALESGPRHRLRQAQIMMRAHAAPDEIPALIRALETDPQGMLETEGLSLGICAGVLIDDLKTLNRYYRGIPANDA